MQQDGSYLPSGFRDGEGYITKSIQAHRIQPFIADGWEVWPRDQDFSLAPPTPGNSYPIKELTPPPSIARIENLSIEFDADSVWASPIEKDATVKALEKEIDGGNE